VLKPLHLPLPPPPLTPPTTTIPPPHFCTFFCPKEIDMSQSLWDSFPSCAQSTGLQEERLFVRIHGANPLFARHFVVRYQALSKIPLVTFFGAIIHMLKRGRLVTVICYITMLKCSVAWWGNVLYYRLCCDAVCSQGGEGDVLVQRFAVFIKSKQC
jgi:hypothetical protein